MWAFAVIITLIFNLSAQMGTADAQCNEAGLKECELKYLHYIRTFDETVYDKGYDTFCDNLHNDSECPTELSEDCHQKFPTAAASFLSSLSDIIEWCNRSSSERLVRFQIVSCVMKNQKTFEQCFRYPPKQKKGLVPDCEFGKFLICFRGLILQVCGEEREKLGEQIKMDMKPHTGPQCSGCGGLFSNHWILDLIAIFALSLRLKILY